MGIVVGAPLLIYGIGYSTQPHHVELALIVAAVYLAITVLLNRWLYRTTIQRARDLGGDTEWFKGLADLTDLAPLVTRRERTHRTGRTLEE